MKEEYDTPNMEIIQFECKDVIITSETKSFIDEVDVDL